MTRFNIFDLKDGEEIGMNKVCTRKVRYYTNVHVRREGNTFILRSYCTDVCLFDLDRGLIRFNGAYSRSTVTHLNSFMSNLTAHYGSMKSPLWESVNRVILNEKIKSCTDFFDRIKWINFNLSKYCVWEKRTGEEDYKDRVYCY